MNEDGGMSDQVVKTRCGFRFEFIFAHCSDGDGIGK